MKRDFKGIWIPKEIWLNENLTLQEKVFLVEIESLDNENGCFANNEYFSKFFGISKTRVSLVIKSLIKKGFIKIEITKQEKGVEVGRKMFIGIRNDEGVIIKNVLDNNQNSKTNDFVKDWMEYYNRI